MTKYCVGYLDDDKGQVNNFYQRFKKEFDLKIINIDNISIPSDIIKEITENKLELIILDFRLDSNGKNFNADELLKVIKNWNPYYPVLILTIHETDAFHQLDDVNIINSKDDLENKTALFILKVEENIRNYKYKKESSFNRLEELIEKKAKTGLSPVEEEEYFNNYRFLNDIEPSERILPSHFLTPQNISSLHDLLLSTQSIIKQLKEEK
jgi:hypothetical protein